MDSNEGHVRRDPDVASDTELAGSGSIPGHSANSLIPPNAGVIAYQGSGFGPLRTVLEQACAEEGCSRLSLTVLAKENDPYRLDTPANHRDGQWAAESA
jgi:hypothetical protein